MSSNFMTITWASFALGLAPPSDIPPNDPRPMTDRPPRLTFEKHVDYHAWYNDYVSRNKTENAYPYYLAIIEKIDSGAIPKPSEAVERQIVDLKYGPVWDPSEYPELAAYLDSCDEVLDEFERATRIPHFWIPIGSDERILYARIRIGAPEFRKALTHAIHVRSWRQSKDQAYELLRAWEILIRFSDHLAQSQMLIPDIMGLSARSGVYYSISAAIAHKQIEGRSVANTVNLLQSNDGNCAVGSGPLVVQWGAMLELLQWLCPDGILDKERWTELLEQCEEEHEHDVSVTFDPQKTAQLIDDCCRMIRNVSWKPYWFLIETDDKFFSRLGAYLNIKEYQSYNLEKKVDENAFTNFVVPSFTRPRQLRHRAETQRHGTMLTLGIHLFHARLGRWPESLDELGEHLDWDDFASIRRDLHNGDDIIYKLDDGEPLLYTVGIDLDDDGGMHDDRWGESEGGGDYRFWPYSGD